MTRRRILNIEVDDLTLQEFLERFDAGFVVTTNVDHLVVLQSRPDFLAVYRRADFATVDSQIVKWALGFLGTPVKAKLSGSDLFPAFCNFHGGDPAVTVFLLGGKDGVAETAARADQCPRWAAHGGGVAFAVDVVRDRRARGGRRHRAD